MEPLQDVLVWVANNIFRQVAILIGLITLVGLLLQRKPVSDALAGALRAAVGVIILFIGVNTFVAGLVAFQGVLASAAGVEPPGSENTVATFLAGEGGGTVALVITVAFLIHLVLVRIFPAARYVYLTGHLMFWISVVVTASFVEVFGEADQFTLVACGSVVVAAYWTLQPLWMRPLMRRVIGSDDFGYGHTSSLLCLLTGYVARPLGNAERHSTEKLRLPRSLSFFKDINVSTALVVGVILLIGIAFADDAVVAEHVANFNAEWSAEVSSWTWGVLQALIFAASIAILLYGVRMFLAEIVPAFKGVSDRLIPGTRPALDAPTVFPVAPTAVIVGFVSGTLVFLILLGVFAAAGWFTLVPPMIMLFFVGGAAGVFGNVIAGWRGAVLGGALNGIILAVGQAVFWGLWDRTAPELATLADPDWYVTGGLLLLAGAPLPDGAIWAIPAVVAAATVAILYALSRRMSLVGVGQGEDRADRVAGHGKDSG